MRHQPKCKKKFSNAVQLSETPIPNAEKNMAEYLHTDENVSSPELDACP